ncbi:MAG TPA: preprotein translocase subunit SecG [Stellaceae bacterium]|nr:preprotein translocase subunit SecG [Stellaceae bacterium]HEV2263337.1 preprotein translocase subunit SecG [Stellaceae bacterium]
MSTVIVVIHLLFAVALVSVILMQKSEGGALGMGGGGMSGFMTGRSTANLLTRTTAILAVGFFLTSIALAIIAARSRAPGSVIDQAVPTQSLPAPTSPAKPATPPVPAAPTGPSAPLTK